MAEACLYNVGGIHARVHHLDDVLQEQRQTSSASPITVLFLLHGRLGSSKDTFSIAEYLLSAAKDACASRARDLLVVTFDHRNHGERLIAPLGNQGWHQNPEKNNPNHANDMYAIQTGSALDVSFLIDFLPSYLFPNGERTIDRWSVAGISLGGHATWICLKNDPRITIGIPIIGCPSFLDLMLPRAAQYSLSGPPTFPQSLVSYVQSNDPSSTKFTSPDPSQNPFIGKKILVLSGGADKLVPWKASQEFVEGLNVGEKGVKVVYVQDGTGHECTQEMIKHLGEFVIEWGVINQAIMS